MTPADALTALPDGLREEGTVRLSPKGAIEASRIAGGSRGRLMRRNAEGQTEYKCLCPTDEME